MLPFFSYFQLNRAQSKSGFVNHTKGRLSIRRLSLAIMAVSLSLSANLYAEDSHNHDATHVTSSEHAEHNHAEHEEHAEHNHAEHNHAEHEEHDEHNHTEHDEHDEAHHSHSHGGTSLNYPSTSNVPKNLNTDLSIVPAAIRAKTEVAVSNYPLYLLSQAVTQGAPSATLLLDNGGVGHHGSLSPADMKTIKDSRYVVWFGNELEANLSTSLAKANNSIALYALDAFHRRPLRDVKAQPIADSLDPHIWLDPDNAKAITRALGAIFARANPEYKDVYERNVANFATAMDNAVAKATANINHSKPVTPYWAYHDAFGYIEPTLHLNLVGALTPDHHLAPKASQYQWLKTHRPQPTMCIALLSKNNESALSKLQPVRSTVQSEDMQAAPDFVSGWQSMANGLNRCARV